MAKESQNKKIAEHLKSGRSITPLEALYKFDCWALSSRISDLVKIGMNIESELIEITSGGKNKYVARYKLIK